MFLFFIVVLFTGTASAYEKPGVMVSLTRNGKTVKAETSALTVGDFLAERGIEPSAIDKVYPPVVTKIKDGMGIVYTRYFPITIVADGKRMAAAVDGGTVADVIADYSAATGVEYVCVSEGVGGLNVTENSVIELGSVFVKNFTSQSSVPFVSRTVENADVPEGGRKVLTAGADGEKEIVTSATYVGGKETKREVVSEKLLKAPVDEIVEIGTKKPEPAVSVFENQSPLNYDPTPPAEYGSKLTMSATAYSSCYACTGKNPGDYWYGITRSGMKARYGVVAVDPNVIPLNTKLYVEGYGYCVAGDTGGAIKGKKIDLYFDSMDTVNAFGRQSRVVYVLN
jgi:3D (Asp-Asp-Asp) domain-containing protein/uncharacterized protein YabE (DUF348 family)